MSTTTFSPFHPPPHLRPHAVRALCNNSIHFLFFDLFFIWRRRRNKKKSQKSSNKKRAKVVGHSSFGGCKWMPDMGTSGRGMGGRSWSWSCYWCCWWCCWCSSWSCTRTRHKWRPGYKFGVLPFVKNFIAYVGAQLKCDVGDRRQRVVTTREDCLYAEFRIDKIIKPKIFAKSAAENL